MGLREFSSLEVKVVANDLEKAMKILKRKPLVSFPHSSDKI
jgi:hypothetical protein